MVDILKQVFTNDPDLLRFSDEELRKIRIQGALHTVKLLKEIDENMHWLERIGEELKRRKQ